MRCHYTYDEEAGKVWIPGCWGGVYRPDACTCKNEITTYAQYEKQKYNKEISALRHEVKELEGEVFRLERLNKKLINHK